MSATYEMLTSHIADDPELLCLIDRLPVPKRQPNLILGAARHNGAPISDYQAFRRWLTINWSAVQATALARFTQTNEAGRVSALLPILGHFDGPLSLIEVGASAGLCLYPDRYSYQYDRRPQLDPDDGPSPVVVRCATTGGAPIPAALPVITSRAGIDLNPLDVTDADDIAWLEILVWPEQHQRRERLTAAAAIVRADPPRLVRGDLTDEIAEAVHQAPAGSTVVVFHSAVLSYLGEQERTRFEERMKQLPCQWISNESPRVLPHIAAQLAVHPDHIGGRFVLARNGRPVALTGPHGQTLDWLS